MTHFLRQLIVNEDAATMVEYALLVALLGSALVSYLTTLKTSISNKFTTVSNAISGS